MEQRAKHVFFGKYLNQVSWEEETCQNKVAIVFFEGDDSPPIMGVAIEHEEPCEGRLSRTVLWEGEGEIPLPDPIVT
jgi:hypothetical protein